MEKYINQILEKNNRVIVPDFGAFIVKQRKPLTIVFNEFLQYNDGMLVDTISKIEDLDREKAKDKVDAFVKSVVAKLDKGQKYPLEKLGTLVKSSSGKISLEGSDEKTAAKAKPAAKTAKIEEAKVQEEKKTQSEKAKAQEDIKAKEENVKKEQEKKEKAELEKKSQDEKEKQEQDKKAEEEKLKQEQEKKDQAEKERLEREKRAEEKVRAQHAEKRASSSSVHDYSIQPSSSKKAGYSEKKTSKRNILVWVIVIVLINGILVTGYFMYNKDLPNFFKNADSEELLIEDMTIEEDNYVTESYEEADEPTIVEEVVPEKNIMPEEKPTKKQIQSGTRYYVVAGAFSIEQNADNLVIELTKKGYNSEKFGKIGRLHAVSYGVFSSKSEANQLLRKIQAETDPQAWIKRMD